MGVQLCTVAPYWFSGSRFSPILKEMAEQYDSNGDYNSYPGDFKRKTISDGINDGVEGENEESNPAAQKAGEYIKELLTEKLSLDQNKHAHAIKLIDQGTVLLHFS